MSSGVPSVVTTRTPMRSAPSATTGKASRRRQRSIRLLSACLLVGLGALAVVVGVVVGMRLSLALAGAMAVVLAGIAVWVVWAEVVEARRLAARDRADQARAYRDLAATRSVEHTQYVAEIRGRLVRHETTIATLETRLADAAAVAADARRELAENRTADGDRAAAVSALTAQRDGALLERDQARAERDRASREAARLTGERDDVAARLSEAEHRAAEASQRVADLEAELDLVMREWRSGAEAPRRKHA